MSKPVDLVQRYQALYSGVIYDALQFDIKVAEQTVVHRDVKPVWQDGNAPVIFGPAITCRGESVRDPNQHIDDMVRMHMFREFSPGCVQVIDCSGDRQVAHFGDISGKIASKFGAVGAVVDGFTRDVKIIREDRFPLFCKGVQPIDAYARWQIVEYQETVYLAGEHGRIRVCPGDYIFGDADGVIVIDQKIVEDVCRLAEERLAKEQLVRKRIKSENDIQKIYNEVGRW